MAWTIARKVLGLPPSGKSETPAVGSAEQTPVSAADVPLWDIQPQQRRASLLRRMMRALAVTALLLVVVVGLRTMFVPRATVLTAAPASETFPSALAAGVAARWASAYLTLVPTDAGRNGRAAALALDTAKGADVASGWNGVGAQQVLMVVPLGVDVEQDGTFARATVMAEVRNDAAAAPQWLTLAIPMATDGTRPVVTGAPAYIGSAKPGPAPRPTGSVAAVDTAVTEHTKAGAASFFRAYVSGDSDALAQASAPGARLAPLAGQFRLASLDGWSVAAGDSTTRDAQATVTWKSPSGGTFRQTYRIQLTAISAAGLTDWRVQTLTAALTEGVMP